MRDGKVALVAKLEGLRRRVVSDEETIISHWAEIKRLRVAMDLLLNKCNGCTLKLREMGMQVDDAGSSVDLWMAKCDAMGLFEEDE